LGFGAVVREASARSQEQIMSWVAAASAVGIAYAAALAYYPARATRGRRRAAVFAVAVGIIGYSPFLVPIEALFLRFLVGVVATAFLVKMYDLAVEPAAAARIFTWRYALWFWNFAALVLRETGRAWRPTPRQDAVRLVVGTTLFAVAVGLGWVLLQRDWTNAPFALEHFVKVAALFAALIPGGVAYSAAWRLAGRPALEMMVQPYFARTPAEFWRRYNLPAQQFFYERVFKPAGGRRHLVRATIATFAVSAAIHEMLLSIVLWRVEGYQTAFFLLQGLAVAATQGVKPRGAWAVVGWMATMTFMFTSGVLFFASIDSVVHAYQNPLPWM
jgi:hypothetical protein